MKRLLNLFKFIVHLGAYFLLIIFYGFLYLARLLASKQKKAVKLVVFLEKFIQRLDRPHADRVYRVELIDLAVQNMKAKSTRTLIAVGGMTIGISAIVFLVSIGYGLQSLVIKRVARLDEMRQVDVVAQPGSNLFLNDDLMTILQTFNNVELVLPQIAVVGKVNYNNSVSDMAVYGVTNEYLTQSAVSPILGRVFDNNETTVKNASQPQAILTPSLIEEETTVATKSANTLVVTNTVDDETGDWVDVAGESDLVQTLQVTKVVLDNDYQDLEAVVNRSFLKVLNLKENEALGKTFQITFIATGKLLGPDKNRLESMPIEYQIIGVTPDEKTPLFYVPFVHLKSLGLNNYSQLKIVVDKESNLQAVRQKIEAQGFATASVTDTVAQINNLFGTARTILALLGLVALCVAALGMFNTLTVSLLERTREIGLLKAMGMKTDEVKDLFLAESMIMGSLGGVLGLVLGLVVGKILEFALSAFALLNGAGTISIVSIPIPFVLLIIILSFLVGVLTGLYPASRARKISALNALRYE